MNIEDYNMLGFILVFQIIFVGLGLEIEFDWKESAEIRIESNWKRIRIDTLS